MTKIAIIHYSMYGHVATMAESIKEGVMASGVKNVSCDIYRVEETLPDEVLAKMHAPPKGDYPVITAEKMTEYDGFLFGISGRYGTSSAQTQSFLDSTGQLWMRGALVGKPAGCFFCSSIQGGGQETMGLTMVPFFTHMGMVYVPLGFVETMFNMDEVHGASAYGSGTFAGVDGSRQPTALEKSIAVAHGTKFAKVAAKLASE